MWAQGKIGSVGPCGVSPTLRDCSGWAPLLAFCLNFYASYDEMPIHICVWSKIP